MKTVNVNPQYIFLIKNEQELKLAFWLNQNMNDSSYRFSHCSFIFDKSVSQTWEDDMPYVQINHCRTPCIYIWRRRQSCVAPTRSYRLRYCDYPRPRSRLWSNWSDPTERHSLTRLQNDNDLADQSTDMVTTLADSSSPKTLPSSSYS